MIISNFFLSIISIISIISGTNIFELNFGKERFLTHFNNFNEINLFQKEHTGSYLQCCNYNEALKTKDILIQLYGENYIHTSYISEKSNTACFIIFSSTKSLIDNDNSNLLLTEKSISQSTKLLSHSIPYPLKIHQSSMFHLGLTSNHEHKSLHETLTNNFKMESQKLLNDFTLIISTGLGTTDKNTIDIKITHERILKQLQSKSPIEKLKKFHSLYSENNKNVWSNYYNKYSTTTKTLSSLNDNDHTIINQFPTCNFNNLQFELNEEHGIIYITKLNDILPISSTSSQQKLNINSLRSNEKLSLSIKSIDLSHSTNSYQELKSCYAVLLATLALDNDIIDIRIRSNPQIFNIKARSIVQSNTISTISYPYLNAGLTGSGEVIGVADTGVDELSCFFVNTDKSLVARSSFRNPTYDTTKRVVIQYVNYIAKYDGDIVNGHGTHVCGTVAGNVLSDGSYNGHGSGAKIAFFDMSTDSGEGIGYPIPLSTNVFAGAYSAGARIHSNSWGTSSNIYSDVSIDIDSYHLKKTDFLAIFAAGNEGAHGYYSVGTPALAKNSLAVGASYNAALTTGNIEDIAYFSSIGPTVDNRIKPEIVAPGYLVKSAASGEIGVETCSILTLSGTSMATPAVAGNAALIRRYYQNSQFWPTMCNKTYSSCKSFAPKGATVKATIIHSGHQMEEYIGSGATTEPTTQLSSTPDFFEGFGRISLPNVLPYTGIETKIDLYVEELTMTSLQKITYTVTVTDTTRPLKATIVWMDAVNTIISSKLLLNDIDLQIIQLSTNTKYYGNNNPGDDINNVEQIKISTPSIGQYQVILSSKVFTATTSQAISLIITSPGYVSDKVISTISSSYPDNELSCGSGDQMISIELFDHGGNGWGSGNSFVIQDSSQTTTYFTFTMNGEVGRDFFTEKKICLTEGMKYIAKFIQNGSNKKEMGVNIQQCQIYLSSQVTSQVIDLTTTSKCNICSDFTLETILYGPPAGITYGWKDDSKYTLSRSINVNETELVYVGTLTTGVMSYREFCLTSGSYYLEFDNVPTNDDYYVGNNVGVSSYRISITTCGTGGDSKDNFDDNFYPYPLVKPGLSFEITIDDNLDCSYKYVDDTHNPIYNDDDRNSATSYFHNGINWKVTLFIGFINFLIIFMIL